MSSSPTERSGKDLATEGRDLAKACVRYGFCTAVCPTHELLRSEQDGPRGRIALIKEMLASDAPPKASTVAHLDRCLSCSACMTPCAAGVNYRRIIDAARAHIERTYARPLGDRFQRAIIRHVLTRATLSRVLLAIGRRVPQSLMTLLPRRLRPFVSIAASLSKPPRPESTGTVQPAATTEASIFLFDGCVQAAAAPRINDAAERLFRRNGQPVTRSATSRCCGALALHMGHPDEARKHAAGVLDEIERLGIERIASVVSTASGCGAVIKEYSELFRGTRREALAAKVAELVRDPIEVIGTFADPLKVARDARFPVAVHEPCSLRLVQQKPGGYARALNSVGLDALTVPDGHACCGSAGSYMILQPDISAQLGARRAARIAQTEPQAVVSANIGCIIQLGRYLDRRPLHAIELLDWINGGPQPPELDGWEQWPARQVEQPDQTSGVW